MKQDKITEILSIVKKIHKKKKDKKKKTKRKTGKKTKREGKAKFQPYPALQPQMSLKPKMESKGQQFRTINPMFVPPNGLLNQTNNNLLMQAMEKSFNNRILEQQNRTHMEFLKSMASQLHRTTSQKKEEPIRLPYDPVFAGKQQTERRTISVGRQLEEAEAKKSREPSIEGRSYDLDLYQSLDKPKLQRSSGSIPRDEYPEEPATLSRSVYTIPEKQKEQYEAVPSQFDNRFYDPRMAEEVEEKQNVEEQLQTQAQKQEESLIEPVTEAPTEEQQISGVDEEEDVPQEEEEEQYYEEDPEEEEQLASSGYSVKDVEETPSPTKKVTYHKLIKLIADELGQTQYSLKKIYTNTKLARDKATELGLI